MYLNFAPKQKFVPRYREVSRHDRLVDIGEWMVATKSSIKPGLPNESTGFSLRRASHSWYGTNPLLPMFPTAACAQKKRVTINRRPIQGGYSVHTQPCLFTYTIRYAHPNRYYLLSNGRSLGFQLHSLFNHFSVFSVGDPRIPSVSLRGTFLSLSRRTMPGRVNVRIESCLKSSVVNGHV